MQNIAKIQANLLPYSIGVYFDAESEAKIRSVWEKLANFEVADYLYITDQRPHLTLGIYKDLDLKKTDEILTNLSQETAVLDISFQYVGVFPTTRSIFLGPVVTSPLLALHHRVNRKLNPIAVLPETPYYLPEYWVPHCGIAIEVEPKNIPEIIRITNESLDFPLDVSIKEIGISTDVGEHNYCCYGLKNK